jgi:hypothetical protein
MWMSKTWTAALIDEDIVAKDDALGFNTDCTACEVYDEGMQAVWSNGVDEAAAMLVNFGSHSRARSQNKLPDDETGTASRWAYGPDGTTPYNAFMCTRACGGTIINGRIRIITNTTGEIVRYWYYNEHGQIFGNDLPDNGDWENYNGDTYYFLVGIIRSPFGNMTPITGEFEVEIQGFGI